MNIAVPFLPARLAAWSTETPSARAEVMQRIRAQYGKTIYAASKLSNVPEELLYAIIFKETRGENLRNKTGSSATGLMQIFPTTAEGFLVMENLSGNLTSGERQVLRGFLNERLDALLRLKRGQIGRLITTADLLKPAFNIHVGAICWSVLLRLHTQPNGTVRFDKAWSQYAWGTGTKPPDVSPEAFYRHIAQKGWGEYFTQLAGREGALHLATSLDLATEPTLRLVAA